MSPESGLHNTIQAGTTIPVPSGFFALNSQDWPVRGATAAPTFTYGSLATYDCSSLHWRSMHIADGVFDWSKLDVLVSTAQATGSDIFYTLYGCPAWVSPSTNVGPYGGVGETYYPNDLSKLVAFINALVARYNGTTRKIKYIQLFNEPYIGTSNSAFWSGTNTQYVDMLATAYAAIKSADPGIVCLTPGTYDNTGFAYWLDALGPVTGKHGYEVFDAIASHPYYAVPNAHYSGRGDFNTLVSGGNNGLQSTCAKRGRTNLDIYATEFGYDSSPSTGVVAAFLALTAAERSIHTQRTFMAAARSGIKSLAMFSYGNTALLTGDLVSDTNGVIDGWNKAVSAMAGKVIVYPSGYMPDGTEVLNFSDGTSYYV